MNDSEKSFFLNLEKGSKAQKKGDHAKAERKYKIAHRRDPDHPVVNLALGTLYVQKEMYGHAIKYLRRAVELGPQISEAYNNLAVALRYIGEEEEAFEVCKTALKQDPNDASNLTNAGSIAIMLGEYEQAETYLRRGVTVDEKNPDAHWNLSLALLSQGKLREGWEGYDWGFRAGERQSITYANEFPEWLGEDLKGKTILVWGEQGIGDEMLFANCIPDLVAAEAKIVLDCHPRLETIFQRSFPSVRVIGNRKKRENFDWTDNYEIDYHIPLGSLPNFFRPDMSSFPARGYLEPDQSQVDEWRKKIGGDLRIGLSWRGGGKRTAISDRSMDLEMFAPLVKPLKRPEPELDVRWVSLQYGPVHKEVKAFEKAMGVSVHHDMYALEDYTETANLVAACDLVISVITAVIHLAGGLDVPCWTLVPARPPWKFIKGERLPWHPSVKQYHQPEKGSWHPTLIQVKNDLKKFLQAEDIKRS